MTSAGIEPATFRFVAQHLNHCATAGRFTESKPAVNLPSLVPAFCVSHLRLLKTILIVSQFLLYSSLICTVRNYLYIICESDRSFLLSVLSYVFSVDHLFLVVVVA